MKTYIKLLIIFSISWFQVEAQFCDGTVPSFNVDLSASPNLSWTSPLITREGNCCGTSNPDKCIEFVITLHPDAIAINFSVTSGAIPPGALFYQIGCGPVTPVGSAICLSGPGPHTLTFCKPGNNSNEYSITSYSNPIIGPDITLNSGCTNFIYANYYDESSVSWNSIFPGVSGAYNSYLSCTNSCDTTYVTAPIGAGAPAYVEYLVCGNDVGGCNPNPICDTIRVNFISPVTVSLSAGSTNLCVGQTTNITANASGGSPAYSYLWNTLETSSSIVGGPGVYYVEVRDASLCLVATDTIIINQFPIPPVNGGPDQIVCEGTAITLNGFGATSYAWDHGVVDGVPFIPAVGTLIYSVTGTDANGCQNTDQVEVTVNPLPVVNAGIDQVVCEGAAVTLSGSGAVGYNWDNGIVDGVSFVQGVGNITYTVIGTDANGCQNTDQVDVIVNPLPFVNAGIDQVVCEGTAVTLGGSGAVGYNWDSGVIDGVSFVQGVGNMTYTVIGTDINGCQNTDQVEVTVNPLPVVNAGVDQVVCEGTAVTLSGSGAVGYNWDNGVIDGVPFVQGVGNITYTVIGTDINGCQNTDQVEVTVNPLPVVNAGVDQVVCEGTAVTLSGSGAAGYNWDNGVIDGVPFVQGVGTTTYTVTGTDANGCQNTDQVDVTVDPLPNVNAGIDQVLCYGVSVTLNGSGAVAYNWDNGVLDGVPFVQGVGTTTYTVIGTDAKGCQNTDQVDVTVDPLPNVSAGPDQEVCEGIAVTLNGSGAVVYIWDNGVVDGVPFIQEVGTVAYTVTGTDNNGCQNTDQLNVKVNPNPIVDAGEDQSLCENDWITLTGSGAPILNWDNGVIDNVPFQQTIGNIDYTVTGILPTGCFASDIIRISILQNPIVSANDAVICEGEQVVLNGNGAISYSWTGGIFDGVPFYPNQSGSYIVTGTAANGCTAQAIANVTVNPVPYVDFDILNLNLTTIDPTTGFDNLSYGAVSYEWYFSDGSPINPQFEPTHTFPEDQAGEYYIELTAYSEFGCSARAVKYVHVFRDYLIYVPNAFTPDNSGLNDVFKPEMTGFDENGYTMYIFNRWGSLVFETHDMEVGWDGTFHNDNFQVQDGVFTWKIEARIKDSADTKIFVGHVSILK